MNEQAPTLADGLVGRDRELGQARGALEAALGGAGALLLIAGEAGIGKTRLLEALVAEAPARALWGASWDDPGTPAFWPWTAVLRDCAAVVGLPPSDELAPVLGPSDRTGGPPEQLRLRLFDAVASYLSEAARIEPLVVVLEDLHFADIASLDLLRFLATTLRGQPVALVGTHRYPDLEPGAALAHVLADLTRAARTTVLHGLDEAAVAALIQRVTGGAPSRSLATRVLERTGGNPLFVTEIGRLLATHGVRDADNIPIPPTVQQVITHRVSYLSGHALGVLAHASVVGQVFSAEVLARVAGERPEGLADVPRRGDGGGTRAAADHARSVRVHPRPRA